MTQVGQADLHVQQPGVVVYLSVHDAAPIPALVLAVAIYSHRRVQYHVAWWDGRQRRSEWVEQSEVEPNRDAGPLRIGFCAARDHESTKARKGEA